MMSGGIGAMLRNVSSLCTGTSNMICVASFRKISSRPKTHAIKSQCSFPFPKDSSDSPKSHKSGVSHGFTSPTQSYWLQSTATCRNNLYSRRCGTLLNLKWQMLSNIDRASLSSSVQSICLTLCRSSSVSSRGGTINFFYTGLARHRASEDALPCRIRPSILTRMRILPVSKTRSCVMLVGSSIGSVTSSFLDIVDCGESDSDDTGLWSFLRFPAGLDSTFELAMISELRLGAESILNKSAQHHKIATICSGGERKTSAMPNGFVLDSERLTAVDGNSWHTVSRTKFRGNKSMNLYKMLLQRRRREQERSDEMRSKLNAPREDTCALTRIPCRDRVYLQACQSSSWSNLITPGIMDNCNSWPFYPSRVSEAKQERCSRWPSLQWTAHYPSFLRSLEKYQNRRRKGSTYSKNYFIIHFQKKIIKHLWSLSAKQATARQKRPLKRVEIHFSTFKVSNCISFWTEKKRLLKIANKSISEVLYKISTSYSINIRSSISRKLLRTAIFPSNRAEASYFIPDRVVIASTSNSSNLSRSLNRDSKKTLDLQTEISPLLWAIQLWYILTLNPPNTINSRQKSQQKPAKI